MMPCYYITMNVLKPDYKKITQVLNYIAEKSGGKVNYMKALKLLYFADRLHLREYGRLITDDNLVAMRNGTLGSQAKDIAVMSEHLPHVVYEYVEDKLKRNLADYSIEKNSGDKDQLSETDIECVDKVLGILGNKDKYELRDLTHELPEWKRHEFEIEQGEVKVVDLDIQDLFKPSKSDILEKIYSQSNEELELSRDMFMESFEQKIQVA